MRDDEWWDDDSLHLRMIWKMMSNGLKMIWKMMSDEMIVVVVVVGYSSIVVVLLLLLLLLYYSYSYNTPLLQHNTIMNTIQYNDQWPVFSSASARLILWDGVIRKAKEWMLFSQEEKEEAWPTFWIGWMRHKTVLVEGARKTSGSIVRGSFTSPKLLVGYYS